MKNKFEKKKSKKIHSKYKSAAVLGANIGSTGLSRSIENIFVQTLKLISKREANRSWFLSNPDPLHLDGPTRCNPPHDWIIRQHPLHPNPKATTQR